jgi:hypothetical protein
MGIYTTTFVATGVFTGKDSLPLQKALMASMNPIIDASDWEAGHVLRADLDGVITRSACLDNGTLKAQYGAMVRTMDSGHSLFLVEEETCTTTNPPSTSRKTLAVVWEHSVRSPNPA